MSHTGSSTAPDAAPPSGRYLRALEIAVEAARAAAAILSAEFARADGPRGGGEHCPADLEAEIAVRDLLLGHFPDHGFVGEEDAEHPVAPRDPELHAWVVDPNDGTRHFLLGRRGASISIGLLRGGLPVLGVVLAHSAPLGGEDLFAWAEGLGPVTRNGRALPELAPRGPLAAGDLVLLSPTSAEHPEASALATAPARFLPVASIAYRLALVAAGEAAAAASLQPLDAHDVAGGHALLRGAGLALLDTAGAPVTYPPAGRARIGPAAAGALPAAADVAERLARFRAAPPGAPPAGLVAPRPGRPATDLALLRRAQGALLGQLCGDSLGSLVEFQRPDEIAEDYPDGVRELADGGTWNTLAGQPTDDSELALALARSLVHEGRFDAAAIARAYAGWFDTRPFDIGHTTRTALTAAADAHREGRDAADAARAAARRESKANGALMRISPLGIFGHGLEAGQLMALAREDARLTHPHPVCQDASAILAVTIAGAVARGGTPAEVAEGALALALKAGLHVEVIEALERARVAPPDYLTHQGLVTVALQNAFFQLRRAGPEEAIVDTVRRGGDTDTNAAVAGALTGAVHGVDALPVRWRGAVLSCFPIEGLPGVGRPRPPSCWAVDALVLAERLVAG